MPAPVDVATVWWLAAGRLPATTAIRMLAPLLGVFADGLGVSRVRIAALIAVFEAIGLAAPAAGWVVDRLGPRLTLLVGLAAFSVSATAAALAPGAMTFSVALVVLGASAVVYEAAATAWIAAASDYSQRAASLGRLDMAWAGGLLIGVPIVAALSTVTWRAATGVIALAAAITWVPLRRQVAGVGIVGRRPLRPTGGGRWWALLRREARLFAGFGLIAAASQLVIVVYGVWLGDRFGASSATIGAVGFLFGVGDLAATTATIRHADRLGVHRAATLGLGLVTAAALSLVATAGHAPLGVLSILVLLGGYEFALLSTKPALTELATHDRGLGIGIGFGVAAGCRGIAAIAGTVLYGAGGVGSVGLAAALTATTALVLIRSTTRTRRPVTG